ncbi:retinol dehydrogenase 14-like isoform X1 [Arctopsyche grandis]
MALFEFSYLHVFCGVIVALGLIALCAVVFVISLIKLYAFLTLGKCKSTAKMEGKTVIITGANGGIGKETAKDLAKRGARVIMACRNTDSANKVKDEIVEATKNTNVVVKKLDLGSLKSIREFAEDINKTEKNLHVLIHNAGFAETFKKTITEDEIETTMATNHYGPFLLTHLLIDLMKKSAPARVVVVASELYRLAFLNLENPNPTTTLPGYLYYVSKYANICFTKELAKRLEGSNVTANCLHPGMVDTGIWRNVPFPLNLPMKLIIKGFFKTPEQGCQTTVHVAVSEELENVSGKYFMDCKEKDVHSGASDMAKAKKLWEISEEMVKLRPTDPKL